MRLVAGDGLGRYEKTRAGDTVEEVRQLARGEVDAVGRDAPMRDNHGLGGAARGKDELRRRGTQGTRSKHAGGDKKEKGADGSVDAHDVFRRLLQNPPLRSA
jgi:hypothetical protein